jgi:hypothetical protein
MPVQENKKINKPLTATVLFVLLSVTAHADDQITREQIKQVISATDTAAMDHNTAAIGSYLGDSFERIIEIPHKDQMATVRLNKIEYLQMVDEGWARIAHYDYQRDNIEIHIMPDGLGGKSHSTVTENIVVDGVKMTSRFREYATYQLENGRPVITQVSGHTLLGDTTPQ